MISFDPVLATQRIHFDQVDSTNAEAKRMIDSGLAKEGILLTADIQTAGRGQYGRTWESAAKSNLMMTFILEPVTIKISDQFLLNIATSMAIAEVVDRYCDQIKIKWPNDIYVGSKKLAGILIQNFLQGSKIRFSIIGIGLNVNQKKWSEEIPNATSLFKELNKDFNRDQLLEELCQSMNLAYSRLKMGSVNWQEEYKKWLFRYGKPSHFKKNEESFSGIIKGVDEIGRLLIEQNGIIHAYTHGEITQIIK